MSIIVNTKRVAMSAARVTWAAKRRRERRLRSMLQLAAGVSHEFPREQKTDASSPKTVTNCRNDSPQEIRAFSEDFPYNTLTSLLLPLSRKLHV